MAKRPQGSGLILSARKGNSLRGLTPIPAASDLFDSTIHYLGLSGGFKNVGEVTEIAVLSLRPSGVPSVGREPEKRRFAPLHRRRLATAISAASPTPRRGRCRFVGIGASGVLGGEAGERLQSRSQTAAEGVEEDSEAL